MQSHGLSASTLPHNYWSARYLIIESLHIAIFKECQLLHTFLLQWEEILLMGTAYISQNTDSRFNHALQGPSPFRRYRLENTQFGFFIQLPDGQRERRSENYNCGANGQCSGPDSIIDATTPFHNGLSITARDTDYRNLEILPMSLGQLSAKPSKDSPRSRNWRNREWRVELGVGCAPASCCS